MDVKKRKQHHVWEHYLKAWATDGRVWCKLAQKPEPVRASTEGVGQERDFYRLKEMSEHDLQVVDYMTSLMEEDVQPMARGWVPLFSEPYRMKRAYEASGRNDPSAEQKLDVLINNLEEEIHASVERRAVPLLKALRAGDASVLADRENYAHFATFLGMQYMRTQRTVRRFVNVGAVEVPFFNAEAAMGLLRTIFAHNIAFEVDARRGESRLTFLDAPSGVELVTGDQPIINTHAVGLPDGVPATKLEYYYPLTPSRALLLSLDPGPAVREQRPLTPDEAAAYNRMIVAESDKQVYARSKEALVKAAV